MSLDGYIADVDGRFEWAAPDEEVHAFVLPVLRPGLGKGRRALAEPGRGAGQPMSALSVRVTAVGA